MSNSQKRGQLFVVSAPSGTGKTTVVERLAEACPSLAQSRSYTSRPARQGERDGVDYNFVSRAEFDRMVDQGEFLEWADVFGHRYGTARRDIEARLASGVDLVLVIDVQGARQVRAEVSDAVGVFILPPSFDVLERRLRARSQDSDEAIDRRLATARREVDEVERYEYVVVNEDLEMCVAELTAIVTGERLRRERRDEVIGPIRRTFEGDGAGTGSPKA